MEFWGWGQVMYSKLIRVVQVHLCIDRSFQNFKQSYYTVGKCVLMKEKKIFKF